MDEERRALDIEVFKRIYSSEVFRGICNLFERIFKSHLSWSDFDALGISKEELEQIRGEKEVIYYPAFCDIVAKSEEGRRRCIEEAERAHKRISSTGKTDIYTCHAGFTEVNIPIMIHGKYCGCLTILGGILLEEPSQAGFDNIMRRLKGLDIDLEHLKKAYFESVPISRELLDVMIKLFGAAVEEIIRVTAEIKEDKKRIRTLEGILYEKYHFDNILGKSHAMQDVFRLLSRVIETDTPVLIEGESGTGKELLANTIHYNSPRRKGPFTPINCGAFVETLLESELFGHVKGSFTGAHRDKKGLFEISNGGTIFLDEIAEMSPALQVKLLRVLQEGTFLPVGAVEPRKVDVRVISATNKNLKELVEKGAFREDLYYRLNVVRIFLPPLRERKEDIPLLVEHFLKIMVQKLNKQVKGISQDAMKILMDYHWPGNIRELQNVLERALLLSTSEYLQPSDLPVEILRVKRKDIPLTDIRKPYYKARRDILSFFQKEYIKRVLSETKGNVTVAARLAGLSRSGLEKLIKALKINPKDYKP
jgi:transcriptional regulator with PAS, ATPase and Fis domain